MKSDSLVRSAAFARAARSVFALVAMLVLAPTARAQGGLSMQGFGYPTGGNSTRVAGTAGALAEFDLLTPRNPSSLVGLPRMVLAVEAEPEYRKLTLNSVQESSTIQRIPLVMVGARLSSKLVMSLSSAGFLDRNYSTTSTGQALVGGQLLNTRDVQDMRGSISDLRAGLGYRVNSRLSVGLAGHVFTGTNRLSLLRQFVDSSTFGTVREESKLGLLGRALSFGGTLRLPRGFTTAASYRAGGRIDADNGDSVLTTATIPDRLSAGVMYTGITGATFAVNVDQNKWTNLQTLGSSVLRTHDATNWSTGAEVATGKLRGAPVLLRVGAGKNTLPFGVAGGKVSEFRIGAGASLAITGGGRDQAALDFSVQRANRTLSGSSIKEGAWLLGIGMQIRP